MRELYQPDFVIQKVTETDDGLGGYIETWEDVTDMEGVIDMLSGETSDKANRPTETSTHVFMVEAGDLPVLLDALAPLDSEVAPYDSNTYDQINYSEVKRSRRIVYRKKVYYIEYIDIPVNVYSHVEVYLRFDGDLHEV